MATGIRLTHPTLKSCMYTVEHPRPYIVPLLCGTCGHPHVNKTYHLQLDSQGACIVSKAVLERLKEIGMAGLTVANSVAKPPTTQIGLDQSGKPSIIRQANGIVADRLSGRN